MALIVELFAHFDAGDRSQWQAGQDTRPLSDLGRRQAERLCEALAAQPLDAIYSSAALRAQQSIEPLAKRFGLPVILLPGLHETDDWLPPPAWRHDRFSINDPLGGAYASGYALGALDTIRAEHPAGRVAACTHGDVLPSLIVHLIGRYGLDLPPPHEPRGGWYTLVLSDDGIVIERHDGLPGFPL